MKLLKLVERIERGVETEDAAPVGMCWSHAHVRIPIAEVPEGSYLATDVTIRGVCAADPETGQGGTPYVTMVDRVTTDAGDLGFIRNRSGSVVGEVTEMRGGVMTWRLYSREELDGIVAATTWAAANRGC